MKQVCLLIAILILSLESTAATITTFAGTGVKGFSGDGEPATAAQLNNVFAVARGPDGFLYFCDTDNHCVRRIGVDGKIETYAGNQKKGHQGDNGPALQASLNMPYEMAWDKDGHLFIVELGNHDVRKIDNQTRMITTIAGTGKAGFSGDGGPAKHGTFNQPHSLAFDSSGDLYVCDILNHRIRKIDMETGIIRTWTGTGRTETSPDGSPINEASLYGPRAIAFGTDGNCFLALREGNVLLRLDPKANSIQRIAGTGKSGFTGNGGPALQATLSGPKCVSLDAQGNVYFADTESHSIRYLNIKTGTLEILVGNGVRGDGPNHGDPLKCQLARPHGVFVDHDGAVFIGDSENHRIRVYRH
jgi:streptogramin lyase